jgi:hypothetical protein
LISNPLPTKSPDLAVRAYLANGLTFGQLMVRVTLTVLVTPPPLPVTVIVEVPVLAVELTVMIMVDEPLPGAAMVEGWNFTVTPLGIPEEVNAMDELNPPEMVVVILLAPRFPRAILTVVGFAVIVKLPPPPLVTVNVTVVVSVVLPAVPVTVMG